MRLPEPARPVAAATLLALAMASPGVAGAWQGATTVAGVPLRWWSSCVYWTLVEQSIDNSSFADPVQPLIPAEELRQVVAASFEAWDEVGCSYLRLVETEPGHCMDVGVHRGAGNANRVFFRSAGWVDPDAPWRQRDQIALTSVFYDTQTGEILDVDIEVNAEDYQLTTSSSEPVTDIQNALTHEVGHLVGLDHSDLREATMWRSADPGEVLKRDLAEDDLAGLCALYPLEQDPGTCREPSGGLDVDCATALRCSPPVDGVAERCWFDELVCCCPEPGGFGRCAWTGSLECAEDDGHGVLGLDERSACSGPRPTAAHACCCVVREQGAECDWRTTAECGSAGGLPVRFFGTQELCGDYPEERDCGCRAAGRPGRGLRALLAAFLPWL